MVLLLGLSTSDHVQQKLGFMLMAAWAASNLAVNYMGFEGASLIIPSLDGAMAILVALVGYKNRSMVALVVFCIYAIVGVVHIVAFAAGEQAAYDYYASLNILFAAQLLMVGTASAWMALRARLPRRRKRFRPYRSRG